MVRFRRNGLVTKIICLPSEKSLNKLKDKKKLLTKAYSQLGLRPREELVSDRKFA